MGNDSAFNRRAKELAQTEDIPLSQAKRILGVPDEDRPPFHPIDSVFSLGLARTRGTILSRSASRTLASHDITPERPAAIHTLVPSPGSMISGRERRPQYDALMLAGFRRYPQEKVIETVNASDQPVMTMPDQYFGPATSTTNASPTLVHDAVRVRSTHRSSEFVDTTIRGVSQYSKNGEIRTNTSMTLAENDKDSGIWLRTERPVNPIEVDRFTPVYENDRAIDPAPRTMRITQEQKKRIVEQHQSELHRQIRECKLSFGEEAIPLTRYQEGDTLFLHELRLFSETFGSTKSPSELQTTDVLAEPIFTVEIRGGFLTWYPTVQGLSETPINDWVMEGKRRRSPKPAPYRCMKTEGLTWSRDPRFGDLGYTPQQANEVMTRTPLVSAVVDALS